jgi:hypothetical protein
MSQIADILAETATYDGVMRIVSLLLELPWPMVAAAAVA